MQKLLSIIIPIYNEEKNIPLIYSALKQELGKLGEDYDYELIFVNDGSADKSGELLQGIANQDQKVKYIEFARNFGKEVATTAGFHNAKGDAAIVIDADLQHPIELIPVFIQKWESGADMVIGIRKKTNGHGLIKKIGSNLFYKIMNFMGETKIDTHTTDFRLIDRKVIDEYNRFTEHNRITRGLLDWLGFKKEYIEFIAHERAEGKASYSKIKLFKLALATFISHSLFPLQFAGYLGILIMLFSGPLGLFIFVDKYILNDPFGYEFTGTAVLAVMILFLVGIILGCLGLIALYIGNIRDEVMNRPLYVVRSRKNLK